ncbi:MAG: hypothetical protein ACR2LR_18840 [Hassallia sp.]
MKIHKNFRARIPQQLAQSRTRNREMLQDPSKSDRSPEEPTKSLLLESFWQFVNAIA